MTKFALIVPPSQLWLLPDTARQLGYHMALGQALGPDAHYRLYYRKLCELGHFVIVDNGAAEPKEERVPFEQVVAWANAIHADEIILPDVLRSLAGTIEALEKHADIIDHIPPYQRMIVPQGEDLHEWFDCLGYMADKWEFHSIGIPKHLERFPNGRIEAVRLICSQSRFNKHPLHFLGIWQNPQREIYQLTTLAGRVRGIDSGAPIAYAQAQLSMWGDKRASLVWNGAPVPADEVERNLQTVMHWMRGVR